MSKMKKCCVGFTGLLLITSLSLAMSAVILPYWAEGPNSTHLGLFLYNNGTRSQRIPQELQNDARKAVAAWMLIGIIMENVSILMYALQICKNHRYRNKMLKAVLGATFSYLIAVAVFGSNVGLQGLDGNWKLGPCYTYAVIGCVFCFLVPFDRLGEKLGKSCSDIQWNKMKCCCSGNRQESDQNQESIDRVVSRKVREVVAEERRKHEREQSSAQNVESHNQTALPPTWKPMSGSTLEIVSIPRHDAKYRKVHQTFSQTIQKTVVKIERVQNPTLYHQFVALNDLVKTRLGGDLYSLNEVTRHLFHGTSGAAVHKICENGFDRSYSGINGTRYGKGVYFAKRASYSHSYAAADENGLRRMILAEVTTGYYTLGNSSMNVVPIRPNGDPYDSVVNDTDNPELFVVFKDASAYPKYIITYR